MFKFAYRIGKNALYSHDQIKRSFEAENAREALNRLVPIEWEYAIYAVIVDENDEVRRISKHPCPPMQQKTREAMQFEIMKYAEAGNMPFFNRDEFESWDYFVTDSDNLCMEVIEEVIKELEQGI